MRAELFLKTQLLRSGKTQALEICCYSQSVIKTQTRSDANQTDLLITYSNEGMRKWQ